MNESAEFWRAALVWVGPAAQGVLRSGDDAVGHYSPEFCGQVMRDREKFTAIGAIGPDLFFFSQDWSNDLLGPRSDQIMLAAFPGRPLSATWRT